MIGRKEKPERTRGVDGQRWFNQLVHEWSIRVKLVREESKSKPNDLINCIILS